MALFSLQPTLWWTTSFYAIKTTASHNKKLSSFTYSGTSYQLSQTIMMGQIGQISLDLDKNQDGSESTGAEYRVTLYQAQSITLQLDAAIHKNDNHINPDNGWVAINDDREVNRSSIDRSIMLTLTYTFGSGQDSFQVTGNNQAGDSNYAGTSWDAEWDHQVQNSLLRSINTTYHKDSGIGNSSSLESQAYFNNPYAQGSLDFNHYFAGKESPESNEISGSLSGSIITTNAGSVLSNGDDYGAGGVLFHLNAPKGSTLLLHGDNSQQVVTPGNTFMSLSAFQTHHVYVTDDPDNPVSMDFNKGNKQDLTIYPGNIIPVTVNAWQTTVIYGEIEYKHHAAKNAYVISSIDTTYTNSTGLFMLSAKKLSPKITVKLANGHVCHIKIPKKLFSKKQPAYWVGKQECK